jgi:hypothetical protein
MPDLKRVEPEDILSAERGKVQLSPLQAIGVKGAFAVGTLATVILLLLVGHWLWVDPALPRIADGLDDKMASNILGRYKEIKALQLEDTLKMVDGIVVRILLPVFTTFVGYIFGSRANHKAA